MDYSNFQLNLTRSIDDDYREFVAGGILTEYPLLGVRTPILREIAKNLSKNGEEEDFLELLPKSYEELTIQGFVIASLPYDKMKSYLPSFVEKIDNWCTTDLFCSSLKSVKKHREDFLNTIDDLLTGPEFYVRTALVCLKNYYVTTDYLAVVLDRIVRVKDREEYYIKMAVAWTVCECFIKYPDEIYGFIASGILPKWTQNKTISKIRDSYRVPTEIKPTLLKLRKS